MNKSKACLIAVSLVVVGCEDQSVLGDRSCVGVLAGCSEEPGVFRLGVDKKPLAAFTFDVAASETLAPSWVYGLPHCEIESDDDSLPDLCSPVVYTLHAAEGGTWVVTMNFESTSTVDTPSPLQLTRLSAEGELLETSTVPREAALGVPAAIVSDGAGGVVLVTQRAPSEDGSSPARGVVFIRSADGTERSFALPEVDSAPPAPHYPSLAYLPDGRMWLHGESAFGVYPQVVWSLDASGAKRWHDTIVPRLNDTDYWAFSQIASAGVAMPDGGYSFMAVVPDSRTNGAVPAMVALDSRGELRWAAKLPQQTADRAVVGPFVANAAGTVALSGSGADWFSRNSAVTGELMIDVLDADGEHLANFWGRRVGYHSASTSQLVVDDAGDVFALVTTGERYAPAATLCKMHPGAEPSARCVAVQSCDTPGEQPLPFLAPFGQPSEISSPEAGAVVLRLSYTCGTAEQIALALSWDPAEPDPEAFQALSAPFRSQIMRFDM